jgi:hypothetical protein
MNRKQVALLLFVCVVPFIGYFFNPNLAYTDAYAFLGGACGLNQKYIIPLIPCNVLAIKTILVGLYAVSIFSLAFFGEKVLGERGWRVGFYSATLSPLLFQLGMNFENDIFGWSLVFVGFALFGIGFKENKASEKAIYYFLGCCSAFLGTFAWLGAYLGVLTLSLMWLPLLLLVIPTIFVWRDYIVNYFLQYLNPNQLVGEETLGAGIVPVMFVFWVLYQKPKNLLFPLATWASFLIGVIKIKYMLFAIPLLMLNFVKFEQENAPHIKHFPNLIVVGLVFACVFNIFGFFAAPTQQDFVQIENAIELANDLNVPLYNDWSYGWWVEYKGYTTQYKASYPEPDYNNLPRPFVALTTQELACSKIKEQASKKTFICK